MLKQEVCKSIAKQLQWSKKDAEYYIAYILDFIILEAMRSGEVRFDSHVFSRNTRKGRKFTSGLNGKTYDIPEIKYIHYKNTRNRLKEYDDLE